MFPRPMVRSMAQVASGTNRRTGGATVDAGIEPPPGPLS
jgi:hypothetical protein